MHRAFWVSLVSRASRITLLEAVYLEVVEKVCEHTVGYFVILKQVLFFFELHLSRPEEGPF